MIGYLFIIMISGQVYFHEGLNADECKAVAAKFRQDTKVSSAFCLDYEEPTEETEGKPVIR
jgi:hypothetical protein